MKSNVTAPFQSPPSRRDAGKSGQCSMIAAHSAQQPESIAEPVTVAQTTDGLIKFNVPAGIPLGDALDQVSLLLSISIDVLSEFATHDEGHKPSSVCSATLNLQFAHALLQGVHDGYIAHRAQLEDDAHHTTSAIENPLTGDTQ